VIKSILRKSCLLPVVILSVVFIINPWAWAESNKKAGQLVGGPCQYKSYPGQATILSITSSSGSRQDTTKRFEVKFSFTPQNKISEAFAQVEGKTFHLYGNNFQYPDREFLISNNIQVGLVLDGSLQAIVSGTCTPVLFEFPLLQEGK
jgi:hypothetical protein